MTTRNPSVALSWLRAGYRVRIKAVNLADTLRHIRALTELEARHAA